MLFYLVMPFHNPQQSSTITRLKLQDGDPKKCARLCLSYFVFLFYFFLCCSCRFYVLWIGMNVCSITTPDQTWYSYDEWKKKFHSPSSSSSCKRCCKAMLLTGIEERALCGHPREKDVNREQFRQF